MSFLRDAMSDDATIGDVIVRARADTSKLKRDLQGATTTMKAEGAKWSAVAHATKIAFLGITAGVVGFAAEGVMAASKFNASLANIYAMTGQTREQVQKIRKDILDMSLEVPQSAKELADAFYFIASAGISAADATDVLKASAMAATAGATDVQTVADGLTSVMNAYALKGNEAIHVTDLLTQTIIDGKSEWGDLAKAIGPVAVYAHTAGISLEEVGAAIASMTQVGYSAQGAADALKGSLRSLAAPSQQQWKTFKALGIEYNANWLKTKGLVGTLQEFEKVIGKVVTVTVKNKDGTTNLNATLAETEKLNRGAFDRWKKLTGGAHGFMMAQVLLNNHAEVYNGILDHMNEAQGKTVETFEKTKEMDPSVTFDRLRNVVMKYAIELGTIIVPYLTQFMDLLTKTLPAAFESIAAILQNTVMPVMGPLVAAFGKLFDAVYKALFGSDGMASGKTVNPLQMFADAFAQIAKMITKVVDILGDLASNPAVAMFIKIAGAATVIAVAFKTISGLSGSLNRIFGGFASLLTGGRFGKTGVTAQMTPEAKALTGSASALDSSAVALKEAAMALREGGFRGVPNGTGGFIAPGGKLQPRGMPAAAGTFVTLGSEEAAIQKLAYQKTSLITQAWARGMAQPMNPAERLLFEQGGYKTGGLMLKSAATGLVGSLKTGASAVKGLLSGGLGLVSKAFWPLMVADIATEFLKAPVGQFIEDNTSFKRAGALMKEDFFGGLIGLFTKSLQGGDAAVGRAETMTIGNAVFNTLSLAKIGVTNATFDKLEAPVGTIEHAQGAKEAADQTTKDLARGATEWGTVWFDRIKDKLPAEVRAAAEKAISDGQVYNTTSGFGQSYTTSYLSDSGRTALENILNGYVNGELKNVTSGVRTELGNVLQQTLLKRGFTSGQLAGLTTEQMYSISKIVGQNADGTLDFMQDFLVREFTGAIQKAPPHVIDENKMSMMIAKMTKKFGDDWETEVKKAIKNPKLAHSKTVSAFMSKAFGENWKSLFADAVITAHPSVKAVNDKTVRILSDKLGANWEQLVKAALANPTDKAQAPMVAYLSKTLGKDWKKLLGDAIKQTDTFIGPPTPTGKGALTATLLASLNTLKGQTTAAITDFWKNLPVEQQQVLADYANSAQTAISPEIQKALSDKFGTDWMAALHAGTDSIADGSKIAKELARVFGPSWREQVQGFGELIFQSEGGEDSVALKKALAGAISKEIASLTPEDLNKPDKTRTVNGKIIVDAFTKPLTPAQQKTAQANIQKTMDSVIKDGTLAAAASPAAATAKEGMDKLSKAFLKMIPDDKARKAFLDQVVALERASKVPTGKTIAEGLATVLPTISTWAQNAGDHLQNVLLPALKNLFGLNASNTPGRWRGGPVSRNTPYWVGEYGKELMVPETNGRILPHEVSMAIASKGRGSRGVAPGGSQTIYVDRMELHNQSDEASVLESLQFLSPAGR